MNQNSNQWDTYASLYNEGKGCSGDKLHNELIQPILEKFLPDLSKKKVLDAGCGNGFLEKWLSKKAGEVIAIDSSDELLKYAKQNSNLHNIDYHKSNLLEPLLFENNSFDVVISVMVIQYLPQIETFAKEIHRVLKQKGKFVFVIDHPGHALFLRAQELVGKKNEKFITTASYFDRGIREKHSLWDKAILQYYHRTISDYLNEFSRYLKLESVVEVSEDGEIPRILGCKFIR